MILSDLLLERACKGCKKQLEWGCETKASLPIEFDGELLWNCPRRPAIDHSELISRVFLIYRWYKQGLLPDPGTWQDQAPKFIAYMGVADIAFADAENQRAETKAKPRATLSSAGMGSHPDVRPRTGSRRTGK